MRWEPKFAERVSFRQTSIVSSNESRFVKRVSFWQTRLVSILGQTSVVGNCLSKGS